MPITKERIFMEHRAETSPQRGRSLAGDRARTLAAILAGLAAACNTELVSSQDGRSAHPTDASHGNVPDGGARADGGPASDAGFSGVEAGPADRGALLTDTRAVDRGEPPNVDSAPARDQDVDRPGRTTCRARTLTVGTIKRLFILCTPDERTQDPLPLVLVFHGGGGRANNTVRRHAWHISDRVDRAQGWAEGDRLVAIYLQGCAKGDPTLCCAIDAHGQCGNEDSGSYSWNVAGKGVLSLERSLWESDDVGYVKAVLEAVRRAADVAIDWSRVYATGHSKGAMMTYRMACDPAISPLIAGTLSVSGSLIIPRCTRSEPTTVLQVTGDDDPATPCPKPIGPPYECFEGDPAVPWQGCARAAVEEPAFGQGIWADYDYPRLGLTLFNGGCANQQWPPVKVGLDEVAGARCGTTDEPLDSALECRRPGLECGRRAGCSRGFAVEWARVVGAPHDYAEVMRRFDVRRFAWERWAADR